jgi:DNA repair protein SbcD/Mre11
MGYAGAQPLQGNIVTRAPFPELAPARSQKTGNIAAVPVFSLRPIAATRTSLPLPRGYRVVGARGCWSLMTSDFTFVHAADIHLDSSLSGLALRDEEFSAATHGATRRAFINIVDLAIREGAALVLIAGDLYDGTWKDQSTGQFAVAQLARLSRAGIRTFIVFGNHDAESRVSRHLVLPGLVHRFDNRRCETLPLDDLGIAIHGRSYKDAATTEDIAATYCPPTPGVFNIAILHTALEGYPGHAPYAPCTLGRLRASGHQYWALGHVHERTIRSEHPHVVYPGNSQGRHVRETGSKGATVVRVRDGVVREVEHHACDEVRWARAELDGSNARDTGELLAGVASALSDAVQGVADRPTAARVTVRTNATLRRTLLADPDWFGAEVRGQASILSDALWIESVRTETTSDDPSAALLPEIADLLASASGDPDCGRALLSSVAPLLDRLPADSQEGELAPLLAAARAGDTSALLTAALAAVEARLVRTDG